jgi:hypothetical protein
MAMFSRLSEEIGTLVKEWEPKLSGLPPETLNQRRNSQNRTIRQITGHLVDSASNNTHRVVHLQYQPSPLVFPNYATLGNNDRWIALQNYQEEDWTNLVQLWKYSMLHFCHVIENIDEGTLEKEWMAGPEKNIMLKKMILDFLPHLKLHLSEIEDLIEG